MNNRRQGFIADISMAALLHRKPASACTSVPGAVAVQQRKKHGLFRVYISAVSFTVCKLWLKLLYISPLREELYS